MLGATEFYRFSTEMMIVTSLLIRNTFEKDDSLKTLQGMENFCEFLRGCKERHGEYLPYCGARYFLRLEEMFGQAVTEEDKLAIADVCRRYQKELTSGTDRSLVLVDALMPSLVDYLRQKYPGEVFVKEESLRGVETREYQLPREFEDAASTANASVESLRDALKKVPKNFRPHNMSLLMFSGAKEFFSSVDKHGRPDLLLEADVVSSADYLTTAEFEEKYFGEGRLRYEKSKYALLDDLVPEFKDIASVWGKVYHDEFNGLGVGMEKARFLLETFPARSALRDMYVVQSLGWNQLEHIEDVIDVQMKVLEMTDVSQLFELSDAFSNPLLSLSVCQRLWELYEQNPQEFFTKVPSGEMDRVRDELAVALGGAGTERLRAILLAHKQPSYVRDELLRPLVDAAPDQASTMALASWYCDPPPGVLRPRTGEVIAVTETLLDVLRSMPQLNKQEMFLYFLGQRFFFSGIDAKFFSHIRENEKQWRRDALFLSEHDFRAKYNLGEESEMEMSDDGELYESGGPEVNERYLVKSPDSLVFLTKTSGIPVEILLQQQRLATTRREQREFVSHLLLGTEGILTEGNNTEFLSSVARNVVEHSAWAVSQTENGRKAMIDLLGFALINCPEQRLPDLFLGLWDLQQDKGSLPEVITALLRELGPLFIKGGQYLGTQSAALPPDWVKAFRSLADKNERAEKTLVYEHEHALYGTDSPFSSIGEKQGEGSMAAVYKGRLKPQYAAESPDVAIKIFHPNTRQHLAADAAFLHSLVGFINNRRDEFHVRLPDNLASVSQNQILRELSFESILKNNKDMIDVLSRSSAQTIWNVPAILAERSKPEFIVHQYSHGVALDSLEPHIGATVRGDVAAELLRQILVEGVYQGDPNIGNFKVTPAGTRKEGIVVDWLDTDHLGRFTSEETASLRAFAMELAGSKSPSKLSSLLSSFIHTETSVHELQPRVQRWIESGGVLGNTSIQNIENIFTSFLDFLAEEKMVLKEQYVTLLRALGLMQPLLSAVSQQQLMPLYMQVLFKPR